MGLMWPRTLLVPMKEGPTILNFLTLLKNRRRDAGAAENIAGMRQCISESELLTCNAGTNRKRDGWAILKVRKHSRDAQRRHPNRANLWNTDLPAHQLVHHFRVDCLLLRFRV